MNDTVLSARKRGRPRGAQTKIRPLILAIHHFRFLSAVFQGVDPKKAFDLYLGFSGETSDLRHIKKVAQVLRAEVVKMARTRFSGDEGVLAAASHLDSARFGWPVAPPPAAEITAVEETKRPSMEEWIKQQGFDVDMYSWAELEELYQEEHPEPLEAPSAPPPAPEPEAKVSALAVTDRQDDTTPTLDALLRALRDLESCLAARVQAHDVIDAWFHPSVVVSMHSAGITVVADLFNFINVHGFRWWSRLDGLGPARGERIVEWASSVAESVEIDIRPTSLTPWLQLRQERQGHAEVLRCVQEYGLVPIERLSVPTPISGAVGQFRSSGPNTFGASTDLEALQSWLNRYETKPKTLKVYRWAAETYCLYCVLIKKKAMSSMVEQDIQDYRKFLMQPPHDWVAPPYPVSRDSVQWRPFKKSRLSASSVRQALVCIKAMYRAWCDAGYTTANPAAGGTAGIKLEPAAINTERSFTEEQWGIINRHLQALPPSPATRRLALVLALGSIGLRREEMVRCKKSDLVCVKVDDQDEWVLRVRGKGDKEREVPCPDDLQALVEAHHRDRQRIHPPHLYPPAADEGELPLLFPIKPPPPTWVVGPDGHRVLTPRPHDPLAPIDATGLYQALKRFFRSVAGTCPVPDRATFERASTHWMRHYFGRRAAALNVEPTAIMEMMGHGSLNTTAIYTKPELKQMIRESRKLKGRRIG